MKSLPGLQALSVLTRKMEQLHEINLKIQKLEERYMATWEDIKAAVTENDNASDAIVMVLDQVRGELDVMSKRKTIDPDELAAVVKTLKENTDEMARRAVRNTPAEEEPVVDTPKEETPVEEVLVEEPTAVEDVPTDVAE